MSRLIVCETDKGNYAVRPLSWAGIWDSDGRIRECGLNHTAVFHCKKDAEWYANMKDAEEQGRLIVLPCKVGDVVYFPIFDYHDSAIITGITINESGICFEWAQYEYGVDITELWDDGYFDYDDIGKTVFLTKAEAEAALEKMEEGQNE